jgi:hypothetical protein
MKRLIITLLLCFLTLPSWAVAESGFSFLPTGMVILYEGELPEADTGQFMEVSPGWALCNGAIASNTALSANFATRMNKKFNRPGDPTDSTRLSDRRGVFPKGFGTNGVLGANYANASGTPQADKMQGHVHRTDYANGAMAGSAANTVSSTGDSVQNNTGVPIADGTNGTPRTGPITEPANVGVHYLVRIW